MGRQILFFAGFSLFLVSCGAGPSTPETISPAGSNCTTHTTQILVADGYLQNLCGCIFPGENGTIFPTPGNLICHLPTSNNVVFFHYLGTVLKHQIIPTNPNSPFRASEVSDPLASIPLRVHVVSFPYPSTTYSFADAYSGMSGQIIVP